MSILSHLKKTECTYFVDEATHVVIAYTDFEGRRYSSTAFCHPDDIDFFSPRVGKRIAQYRVYQSILRFYIKQAREEWLWKDRYYREVLGFGSKEPAEVDPSGAFKRNLERAAARY